MVAIRPIVDVVTAVSRSVQSGLFTLRRFLEFFNRYLVQA
jgi:hypothetical protein